MAHDPITVPVEIEVPAEIEAEARARAENSPYDCEDFLPEYFEFQFNWQFSK